MNRLAPGSLRLAAFCGIALLLAGRGSSGPADFVVVPAESRVSIDVGKSGILGFAGHGHEVLAPAVRGTVTFGGTDWTRASVSLDFDAASLKVSGKGEPPADVPEVQQTMLGARVLDTQRYPVVSFRSTRVTVAGVKSDGAEVRIDGTLTLHGVSKPFSVPARVTLDGPDALTAAGSFTLKQSEFGMEPVTAAGGTVKVKDELGVTYRFKARREAGGGR